MMKWIDNVCNDDIIDQTEKAGIRLMKVLKIELTLISFSDIRKWEMVIQMVQIGLGGSVLNIPVMTL